MAINFPIGEPRIEKTLYSVWFIKHPSNAAILACCHTEAEALQVKRGLEELGRSFHKAVPSTDTCSTSLAGSMTATEAARQLRKLCVEVRRYEAAEALAGVLTEMAVVVHDRRPLLALDLARISRALRGEPCVEQYLWTQKSKDE